MSRVGTAIVVVLLAAVAGLFVLQTRQPKLRTEEDLQSAPVSPEETYDPFEAGEQLPSGYRQLLRRDAIRPVYTPSFVPASEADWASKDLVIGLAVGDEAKAYPVGFLNRREMVVDSISGIPVLVTW